jgi:uncharacterized membrane protein YcfT
VYGFTAVATGELPTVTVVAAANSAWGIPPQINALSIRQTIIFFSFFFITNSF